VRRDLGVGRLEVSLRVELDVAADAADAAGAGSGAGTADGVRFRAVVQLRSLAAPTVFTDAAELWAGETAAPEAFGPHARADVHVALRRAARVWAPAERLLDAVAPTGLDLSDAEAGELLGGAAGRLAAVGVVVHWPKELVRGLTARAYLEPARESGGGPATGTASSAPSFLSAGGLVDFRWRVALGEETLSEAEVERLVQAHRPVVRLRNRWVVVDGELARRLRTTRRGKAGSLSGIEALGAALTGSVDVDGEQVAVVAGGALEELRACIAEPEPAGTSPVTGAAAPAAADIAAADLDPAAADPSADAGRTALARADRLAPAARQDPADQDRIGRLLPAPSGPPSTLVGTLRGYQLRGVDWLDRMTSLGLGACLADDMGLGKTVTLIALHLRRAQRPAAAGPTLVVCPASLLGTWEREIRRFAPTEPVHRFHGAGRELDTACARGFVLTTYGTMRRDTVRLGSAPGAWWSPTRPSTSRTPTRTPRRPCA
jgi:hypothetical protein